ncbi:hypothetical protein P0082_01810 [Candidatus Haliotispira prima]|uniref:Uncharacterized protein n=1 Tax=Candidatus Haliotispira prima TaxID=3034016 RepID=A0ABY8MHY7_9SPIO|nr:hypothetical protein P0082_01810 [Candidatus Haliotispira prima]
MALLLSCQHTPPRDSREGSQTPAGPQKSVDDVGDVTDAADAANITETSDVAEPSEVADISNITNTPDITNTPQTEKQVPETAPETAFAELYDIFNRLPIQLPREGRVSPSGYYWGSLEVTADRKVRFFVDDKMLAEFSSYFQKQDLVGTTFETRGELPESGDLSRIYFLTPRKSGFLFSGSISLGNGMTSLLPPRYRDRLAHVEFIKRPAADQSPQ